MMKSCLIFVCLIIVGALFTSGCLQREPTSNSSSLTASHATENHTLANQTFTSPAQMNMSAPAELSSNEVTIYLMAKNIAFNQTSITVPAGANVTMYFDNQDSGVPHNFAVYDSPSASETIFQGKIITGSSKIVYTFTAPSEAATYFFRCDIHPTTMTGRFIVQPSKTGPQSAATTSAAQNTGAAATASAQMKTPINIKDFAFDPSTVTVQAGTSVTWINLDTVPHTVTSTNGTFDSGILRPGRMFNYTFNDPGTYNYYCTIHPYMKGQVIVTPYNGPYPKSEIPTEVPISTTSPQPSTRITIDLLAKDINFDKDNITVLAGAQVNIDFYNLDVGMPHNFAVYANSGADTVIYQGPVVVGPKQIIYTFNAPVDPGIYFFRCDVHPKVMTGNFYVVSKDNLVYLTPGTASQTQALNAASGLGSPTSSQNAAAVGSGSQTITLDLIAENLAFDKNTITVPAGAKVTINFNNKDSGVPHNFAAYTDSSATTTIFKGNVITGPAKTTYVFTAPSQAGTYFFRCDIHPTQMTGQFVVESVGAAQRTNVSDTNMSAMKM
ncbi:MAG: cupredoxin domain-containing protein [Methanotrichaceae archaeon]